MIGTGSLPDRLTIVDEGDFWSSLRPARRPAAKAELLEAVRLGKGGDAAAAITALAVGHRKALAREWRELREARLKLPAPDASMLKDLRRHKFDVWFGHIVQFDQQIDWGRAGIDRVGLHSLHWLDPALTAYIQTGDQHWRDLIIDIVGQLDAMPRDPRWPGLIRRYAFEYQSVSAKWRFLLAAYLAFIHDDKPPTAALAIILRMFMSFGRTLDYKMKRYIAANNLFAEAIGTLLSISRVFPEFAGSQGRDRKAVSLAVEHARDGYFKDGGSRERIWGYGVMHLQSLVAVDKIGQRYGGLGEHGAEIRRAVRRACRWYAKTAGPSPKGCFPTYGDAGWSDYDRLPTIAKMADFLPGSADGSFGVDRGASYLLRPSGFAIMRSGNEPGSTYINLNFGRFAGWHSHWDLLSMNLWSQGEPLLEELCRFGPYSNPLDTLFRSPESHNLTLIDGMIYDSREVQGRDVAWASTDSFDYFSATHRAYRYFVYGRESREESPNIEALVRRTVLLVKDPGYAVVMDSVRDLNAPNFNRAISQYWHSPSAFQPLGPGRVRTRGKRACLLLYAHGEGLHRLDSGVDFAGEEIEYFRGAYPRYSLRARRWMSVGHHPGILGFTTVLYPFTGTMPAVSVRALPSAKGERWKTEAIEIVGPRGRDRIELNPERLPDFTVGGKPIPGRARVRLGKARGDGVIE